MICHWGFSAFLLINSYLFLNFLPLLCFPNSLACIEPYSYYSSLIRNFFFSSLWCQVSGVVCIKFCVKRVCPVLIINEFILERQSCLCLTNVSLACVAGPMGLLQAYRQNYKIIMAVFLLHLNDPKGLC